MVICLSFVWRLTFVGQNQFKASAAQHHVLFSHLFNRKLVFALAQECAAELFWVVHADVYFHLLAKLWRNDGGFYFKHSSGCCGARAIHQPNADTRSANGHYGVHLLINTSRSGAVYAHLLCRPAATYGYFKRFKLAVFTNSLYVGLAFVSGSNF